MIPLRQNLMEMVWTQPKKPIQCESYIDIDVANDTIIPFKKTMDMQFRWIHFHDSQYQLCYFRAPVTSNLGNYSTKNRPPPPPD